MDSGGPAAVPPHAEAGAPVVRDVGDGESGAVEAAPPKCPNLRGILKVAENRRVLISVIPTLTLAIMGG